MKKPEYKIGDYVEVETCRGNRKGFIVRFVNLKFGSGHFVTIKNRRNDVFTVESNCIIRKLPILRDKNGRFMKEDLLHELSENLSKSVALEGRNKGKTFGQIVEEKLKLEEEINKDFYEKFLKPAKKSCSCFNCDKCAEQMRAYYEKTGELKAKTTNKTEEKKPSEVIIEAADRYIKLKDYTCRRDKQRAFISAVLAYLDEQFEKNE